jgi:DNA-binding CsgD family transcriptional regulator
MVTDTSNSQFQLAADFINYTNRSVFLTGKAGTGKTTFLKYIKQHSCKQIAVVAPTGVAAINAGGVTIHSFFQLPFTPFVPETKGFGKEEESIDKHYLLGRLRITTERRKLFQQLELLVIDEISMVRADVLDAIDTVLRYFTYKKHEPFGGVQLLLIGDMYQLPPVVKEEEWNILSQYYESPFFFSSKVMQQHQPAFVELNKIYRQTDSTFIHLLNKVRNSALDKDAFKLLQQLFNPSFQLKKEEGYITLTTHNYKADAINKNELEKLTTEAHFFKAIIEKDFSEKSYPADENLQLKIGSQVMFIKNDTERTKRYFNGKIGIVEKIENNIIFVQCSSDPIIEVKRYRWENIRYTVNNKTQKIEEEVIGAFTQFPLRLAWAITIHKSQGLTFEKAVIDAGQAFAAGQVYVALSRCTNLQGIVLLSSIANTSLRTDERIEQFSNSQQPDVLNEALITAKRNYQTQLLQQLFNIDVIIQQCAALIKYVEENNTGFNNTAISFLKQTETLLLNEQEVFKKFELQLQQLLLQHYLPEENTFLQQRISKAAGYFEIQLQNIIQHIQHSPAETDSKQHALHYNEAIKELFTALQLQKYLIAGCKNRFAVDTYFELKKNFELPAFFVNAYAVANSNKKTNSPHPLLHQQLRKMRDSICETGQLPVYIVANSKSIDEMAQYLPQSITDLKKISGFGEAKAEKYGSKFLNIIQHYCNEHGLTSLIHEMPVKKEKKPKASTAKTDTKNETYQLFKKGKAIAAIAAERNLAVSTLESHLSHYVLTGALNINELLSKEKLIKIESALHEYKPENGVTVIKQKLGDGISYGEIKWVLAWKEFNKARQQQNITGL